MVYVIALLLFVIHILAFAAGSANGVVMPILGPKLATASPETREHLFDIAEKLSKVGKIAMGTLLVTGILTLWLKWDWIPPNAIWFWIKMAGVVAMIVFIVNNEVWQTGQGLVAARGILDDLRWLNAPIN